MKITICIFFLFLFTICVQSVTITVDPTQTTSGSIYKTLGEAFASISPNTFTTIEIKSSTSLKANHALEIKDIKFQLKSSTNNQVTIDCQSVGNGLILNNVPYFLISGINFLNCMGTRGGALSVYNSKGTVSNSTFTYCRALKGGSIYSYNSEISVYSSVFPNNVAWVNDIYAENSQLTFDAFGSTPIPQFDTTVTNSVYCKNSSVLFQSGVSVTTNQVICGSSCVSYQGEKSICSRTSEFETQKSYFSGMMLTTSGSKKTPVSVFEKSDFMGLIDYSSQATLEGFIKVEESKHIVFEVVSSNIEFSMYAKGISTPILESSHYQSTKLQNDPVFFESGVAHKLIVNIKPLSVGGGKPEFIILPFNNTDEQIFYSKNICGDGIYEGDDIESSCFADKYLPDVCNYVTEYDINNNIDKCYKQLSHNCPARSVPKNHIAPGFYFEDDTLGDLISDQMVWKLPGSEHFTFGVDIVTGEEGRAPLFQFDYCNEQMDTIIEDPFRGLLYEIPPQLNVKSLPQCSFSTSSTFFSSTSEMQQSMASDTSVSASIGGGGSEWGVSISASVAFSGEKSVSTATDVTSTSSQTVIVTDIDCFSSYVEVDTDNIKFHPHIFERFISMTSESEMLDLIETYGTAYYKSSYLGGRLRQVSTTTESVQDSSSQSKYSKSASASISASGSGYGVKVSASVSAQYSDAGDTESQSEATNSMTTSNTIAYGGAPSALKSDYSKWSSTIDLFPTPLDYKLTPVRDAIDPLWMTKVQNPANNSFYSVLGLWKQMEEVYYAMNGLDYDIDNGDRTDFHYTLFANIDNLDNFQNVNEYPSLEFSYLADDNTRPIKSIPLPFIHTYPDGEEQKLNMYGTIENFNDTIPQPTYDQSVYNPTQLGLIYESRGLKSSYSYSDRALPLRFDFTSKFDLLNLKEIKIKLIDLRIRDDRLTQFVQWKSGNAILLNSQGMVYSDSAPDTLHLEFTYEHDVSHRLSSELESNLLNDNKVNGEATGLKAYYNGDSRHFHQGLDPNINDFESVSDPFGDYFYYNYKSISMNITNRNTDSVYMYYSNPLGGKIRVNWILMYVPDPSNKAIYNVKSFNHVNTKQYPFLGSEQFNLTPLNLNGPSHIYHTINYNMRPNGYNSLDNGFNTNAPENLVDFLGDN